MATKTMEVKESPLARHRSNGRRSLSAYGKAQIHRTGNTAQRRRVAQDRRLLASLQLPGSRHDLSAGQSSAEGTPQAGAYQEPAARTLGSESRPRVYLHSPEPADQETTT